MKRTENRLNQSGQPHVIHYTDNLWEFTYPASVDNETVYQVFSDAVDLLDYDDGQAEAELKKLVLKHPYYIDAYNHLSIAFRNQDKIFESLLTAEKAFQQARSCFPKGFKWKDSQMLWGHIENRPFFRAIQCYGLECQYHKNHEKAIELYQLGLSLNPGDHQGLRYLLLETYFSMGNIKEADNLLSKHTDDGFIDMAFGRVTLAILENNIEKADSLLDKATVANPHFIYEVCKDRHRPPAPFRLPNEPFFDAGVPVGSVQEAYEYWSRNREVYKRKEVLKYYRSKNGIQSKS